MVLLGYHPRKSTVKKSTPSTYFPSLGGTQIWFGRGCAARALKPLPILRVIMAKSTNFQGFFMNYRPIFHIFLGKQTHIWRYFCRKWDPRFGISCEKVTHKSGTSLYVQQQPTKRSLCVFPAKAGNTKSKLLQMTLTPYFLRSIHPRNIMSKSHKNTLIFRA